MPRAFDLKKYFFSLKTAGSFLLAFAIIYFLVNKMDTAKVWAVIKQTRVALYALAFVVYFLAYPLRGLRSRIMLMVGILVLLGVERNLAVSAALLDRLINYWALMLVGFIVYMATAPGNLAKEAVTDESAGYYSHLQ